jgi:hypothetical protein
MMGRTGLRLLFALALVPWTVFYGVTGVWATAAAGTAFAREDAVVLIGATHADPGILLAIGIVFLVGFVATLTATVLLAAGYRGRLWQLLLAVLILLSVVALWAGLRTHLGLGAGVAAFAGLFLATGLAVVMVLSRPPRVVPAYGPAPAGSEEPPARVADDDERL